MSLACLAHVNFLLYIYFDVITEQINDDDDDDDDYVAYLRDVACQKLLKSVSVSRSYSKNNTGIVFWRHGVINERAQQLYQASNIGYSTLHSPNIFTIGFLDVVAVVLVPESVAVGAAY